MNVTDLSLPTKDGAVAARLYRAASAGTVHAAGEGMPLVLHLHGGAFQRGDLSQGACVAGIAAEAGAVVVDVDYPSGAAHPFPFALKLLGDLLQGLYRRRFGLAGRGARLFVAGEEAGGNLAAALAVMTRDQGGPPLAGQVLIGPMLNPCQGTPSLRAAGADQADCDWARGWRHYLGNCEQGDHPYAAPACSSRLAGLAPALMVTAEDDPMRDETLAYARALQQAGVNIERSVLPGRTGWPASLLHPPETPPPWVAALRDSLARFFFSSALMLS